MTEGAVDPTFASTAAADPARPSYHVVSPANWLNDPNGLIQRGDTYHMFYQYNPHNPRSETKHWGHVSSRDLVHWTHLPIALAPELDGPDADGVYSGCAIDLGNHVLLMYTGVRGERQLPCVATSNDPDLVTWTKYPGNPVITQTPPELDLVYYRDHTVWREGKTWYMGIACRIRDVGGAVLLYRSDDLHHWEYVHPLATGNLNRDDPLWAGTGWECPDFFVANDGRHVLIVSGHDDHPRNVIWMTGAFANHHLEPSARGLVDGGPSFYAPQSFTDNQGRRVMFGWLRERRSVSAQVTAGWSGALTLPRILTVDADGMLVTAPAPENNLLRMRTLDVAVGVAGDTTLNGETIEVLATFRANTAAPVGLTVRANRDGSEATRITWDSRNGVMSVDTRNASIAPGTQGALSTLPVLISQGSDVSMRVYLDRSLIEVYLNDRACISERVYPADPASTKVTVIGPDQLVSLAAWDMGNAFAEG